MCVCVCVCLSSTVFLCLGTFSVDVWMCVCVCVCVRVSEWVCVCVRERERESRLQVCAESLNFFPGICVCREPGREDRALCQATQNLPPPGSHPLHLLQLMPPSSLIYTPHLDHLHRVCTPGPFCTPSGSAGPVYTHLLSIWTICTPMCSSGSCTSPVVLEPSRPIRTPSAPICNSGPIQTPSVAAPWLGTHLTPICTYLQPWPYLYPICTNRRPICSCTPSLSEPPSLTQVYPICSSSVRMWIISVPCLCPVVSHLDTSLSYACCSWTTLKPSVTIFTLSWTVQTPPNYGWLHWRWCKELDGWVLFFFLFFFSSPLLYLSFGCLCVGAFEL